MDLCTQFWFASSFWSSWYWELVACFAPAALRVLLGLLGGSTGKKSTEPEALNPKWEFPKIRSTILGVP